ncbi:MAG: hypothetical protein ABIE68_04860 [bacterium]
MIDAEVRTEKYANNKVEYYNKTDINADSFVEIIKKLMNKTGNTEK